MTHSDAPAAQPGCVLILAAGRDGELAMKVLTQAGLLRGKRIKQWTFYRRDEAALAEVKAALSRL